MERRDNDTTSSEKQRKEDDDMASGTEEECLEDTELFNTIMREGSIAADDEDHFDDGSFDAQLAEGNEEPEDPFEMLPEMDVIKHNIFDL